MRISFPAYTFFMIPSGHDKGLPSSVMCTRSPFFKFCFSTRLLLRCCIAVRYSKVHFFPDFCNQFVEVVESISRASSVSSSIVGSATMGK